MTLTSNPPRWRAFPDPASGGAVHGRHGSVVLGWSWRGERLPGMRPMGRREADARGRDDYPSAHLSPEALMGPRT
jgi:hypothetical protein